MMKQLWAPWRMEFLKDDKTKTCDCVFCALPREKNDQTNLIVHRAKYNFVILNKYPYNNGHLMVVPFKHTSNLGDLSKEEQSEMMEFGNHAISALKEAYKPEGFNLGMNLGQAAGAGIKDHLHLHIVPRWNGDTNFMPVIGDVKSMPEHLQKSFESLKIYFGRIQ